MSVNNVILAGNLTHDPYFDYAPESGLAFTRFYLAVSLPRDIAIVLLKGNVAQPPYYDLVGTAKQPFMRLYLAVDRPSSRPGGQSADFLRVVAYADRALFDYPYLQPGAEILVSGSLRARKHGRGGKTETVVEVIADPDDGITFLHKINFEGGDAHRLRVLEERAASSPSPSNSPPEYGGGFFRVVAYGRLAEACYEDLHAGAGALVVGQLRARKHENEDGQRKTVVEVVARTVKFIARRGDTREESG